MERDPGKIIELASNTFTEEENAGLLRFYERIWAAPHDYKALIARRAFDLNHCLYQVEIGKGRNPGQRGIMSNTALLLQSEEIAHYYYNHGFFPKILIVDDILLHGRGIYRLICNLEELIAKYLSKYYRIDFSLNAIHSRLMNTTDIWVYGRNQEGLIIDQLTQSRISEVEVRSQRSLKELSQKISRFIQQSGIPNTSYVATFRIPGKLLEKKTDWSKIELTYRGNHMTAFLRESSQSFFETIRFYPAINTNEETSKINVTSLAIFGDLSLEDFEWLKDILINWLGQHGMLKSSISTMLTWNELQLYKPQAQFISLILSILSFLSFAREFGCTKAECANIMDLSGCENDIGTILLNFASDGKLHEDMSSFLKEVQIDFDNNPNSNLYMRIKRFITNNAYRWGNRRYGTRIDYLESSHFSEKVEDILYDVGMTAEEKAYMLQKNRGTYSGDKRVGIATIHLIDYFKRLQNDYDISNIQCIAYSLEMMDSGVTSMNVDVNDEQTRVTCLLKAGELSTFVYPRRLSMFIPALSKVEEIGKKLNLNRIEIRETLKLFIRYVSLSKDADDEEYRLFKKLKQIGNEFISRSYECGQEISEWKGRLMTPEERLERGNDENGNFQLKKYVNYILNDAERQKLYVRQAEEMMNLYYAEQNV